MSKGDLFLPYFLSKNFKKSLAFYIFMCYNIIDVKITYTYKKGGNYDEMEIVLYSNNEKL